MLASLLACGSAAALRSSQQQATLHHHPEAVDLMGDQDWTSSDPIPSYGLDEPGKSVFVISSKPTMHEQTATGLLKRLTFKNVGRITPVQTSMVCVEGDPKSTGTVMAHRHAWRTILGTGEPAVVLEADWSIGNQSVPDVIFKLNGAFAKMQQGYDLVWLGYCELQCDAEAHTCGGPGYGTRPPLCLTGYLISPSAAQKLLDYKMCNKGSRDWESDGTPPVDWYVNHKCKSKDLNCYVAAGPEPMPGCFGQGIFQQNESFSWGLHAASHLSNSSSGPPLASPVPLTTRWRRPRASKWDDERVASWYKRAFDQRPTSTSARREEAERVASTDGKAAAAQRSAVAVLASEDEGDSMETEHPHDPFRYIIGQPSIVFAISTGRELVSTRAKAQLETWCSNLGACVFFSDQNNNDGEGPVTKAILLHEFGFNHSDVARLEVYQRAQLRFLPVLSVMKQAFNSSKESRKFKKLEWLVMADDDTYVFYYNLQQVLAKLDCTTSIYTGNVAPQEWFPVRYDEYGHDLGVSSDVPFVDGGAGSIFSRAAVEAMDVDACVKKSLPGGEWWKMQSDWMLGLCADSAGFRPTALEPGTFNSFACTDDSNHVHFCRGLPDGEFTQPATIHPVKTREAVDVLWSEYPNSRSQPATNIALANTASGARLMTSTELDAFRMRGGRAKAQPRAGQRP